MEWRCWDLLNDGAGPRGKKVEVFGVGNQSDAAEQAAEYFDDIKQKRERYEDSMFDGAVRYIEVEGDGFKPSRHEVVCEVQRHYTAVVK